MRITLIALSLGTTAALAAPVAAEYPTRPIQMVIPFGPGGATDLSARALAAALGSHVPQPLVLTNRTGAGGAVGSVAVRDAAPDGYTLLLARVGSHTVNPAMNPNLPYTIEEFRFVGIYEINPVACVVNTNSDIETIEDLITKVEENPGQVLFSSAGVGTLPHFGALMVLDSFGITDLDENVIHIPTEGDGQALTAVLQQTADFYCGSTSPAAPFIASGQMRPLLVTTPERVDGFDAPTAVELDKPELQALVGWTGIAGPADMPDEVSEKWGEWLAEAVEDAEFVRFMTSGGSVVTLMSPEESVAFVNDAYESFRRLVVELDMEIE
jgi:tripartite-type tricarboxylate transporter receptor subunit TctC